MFVACQTRLSISREDEQRAGAVKGYNRAVMECGEDIREGVVRRRSRVRKRAPQGTERDGWGSKLDNGWRPLVRDSLGDSLGSGRWDQGRRTQLYERLLAMVRDPCIPELTVTEAQEYIRRRKAGGIQVGGFFPSDIEIAARSLKLTRRLFHVAESSLCSGKGLWLNKGVKVGQGDFVGFYVGWIYTQGNIEAVWDQQFLDNTYSLGLGGLGRQGSGDEELLVLARDEMFGRQDLIFPLGHANEWIWGGKSRHGKGNSLRFGKDGMMFSQRAIHGGVSRVEVTVGFGKEGVPFGGWFQYTVQLAGRLIEVVKMVWCQVQKGLKEVTVQQLLKEFAEVQLQLNRLLYQSMSTVRQSTTVLAVLIAGVELQDVEEDWGWLSYNEDDSVANNLRRFVLHPAVRKRCAFRMADKPGEAESRGVGKEGFWEKFLMMERKLMEKGGSRGATSAEGRERVDGRWEWRIPIPLRREEQGVTGVMRTRSGLLAAKVTGGHGSECIRADITEEDDSELGVVDSGKVDNGLKDADGESWEQMDRHSGGGENDFLPAVAPLLEVGLEGLDSQISERSGETGMDNGIVVGGRGGVQVSMELDMAVEFGGAVGRGDGGGLPGRSRRGANCWEGGTGSGESALAERAYLGMGGMEGVPSMTPDSVGVEDTVLVGGSIDFKEGADPDNGKLEEQTSSREDRGDVVVNGWAVGSRWIYDYEEVEVCKIVSETAVEVVFADGRKEITSGPFSYPDVDDFLGWPNRVNMARGLSREVASVVNRAEDSLRHPQDDLDVLGVSGGGRSLLTDAGIQLEVPGDCRLRIATWNASGLTQLHKVRYVVALMAMAKIDVLCIQDTRLEPGQWATSIEGELKRLLGPGGSVFVATVAPRVAGSKGPNVGGQIILKSSRIRSSCGFHKDDSSLGLVCCLDIQLGSHDTRIVSVYVPPAKGEKVEGLYSERPSPEVETDQREVDFRGALAVRVLQFVQQSDKWEGCIDYILGTAQRKIEQHLRVPGGVVLCVGDFNASGTLEGKRSVNGTIAEWVELVGLRHSMGCRLLDCPITFFRGLEGVSAIDHVLFSDRPGVSPVDQWTLHDSLWLSLSNHCPLVVDFEMQGLTGTYVSRRGRRLSIVRERLDICRARGDTEGVDGVLRDVDDFRRYIEERLREDELAGPLDDQLELIMRVTKAALRSVRRRRRKTDWWSPIVVAITANLIAVQEIERYAYGRGRPQWIGELAWQNGLECITRNWRRQISRVNTFRGEGAYIDLLGISGKGPDFWVVLHAMPMEERLAMVASEIRRLRALLRQQERLEVGQSRQDVAMRRLAARSKGVHLRELRDIMGGRSGFSMDYIVDSGLYVVEEQQVHDIVSAHFREWFVRKERPWGFLAVDCDYRRLWCDKEFFMLHHAQSNIPEHLLDVIWAAMRPKTTSSEQQCRFEQFLMEAPTLDEFELELSRTSRHSAGGPTGVTYNAIAGWPRWVLRKVHLILVDLWEDKRVPKCWKWRWLVPIPKTTDNVTLGDLRPLMLTDVVRKVWVGVLIRKIQDHFGANDMLSKAQHGTLATRGTEGALVQFRNILEEARESCTDVFLSSWDVVKAFDRLQKHVQIMSWVRLGIPEELAEYLVSMDDDGVTIVRTPYAEQVWENEGVAGFSKVDPMKAAAFAPSSGTGQGNIDSPLVWIAFMDILLCALATLEENQFYIRTQDAQGEGLSVVQDIAYVDDLVSLTARLQGLQSKADVVCAFFIVFGMDSARIKFRTFQVEWGAEYTAMGLDGVPCRQRQDLGPKYILVRKEGWQARKVWVQTYRTSAPFKYLGVLFDLSNHDLASFDRLVSVARKDISVVCRSLGDFELRVEALLYCVYPKLVYSAKFASWPLRRYLEIDKLFSAAFRKVLGLRRGFPEDLLYAPWGFRGIGLSRFSDEVQMSKLAIVCRGATADQHTREATLGLVLRGLRQQNMKPLYTQASTLGTEYISTQPLFVRSISEWLLEGELALRKGGVEASGKSHMSIGEFCGIHSTPLSIAEQALLEAYGISSVGDIVMIKEYVDEGVARRGRSRTRAVDGLLRRGMEGMVVESPAGNYEVVRYVHPSFVIRWVDGRVESVHYDFVNKDISSMAVPPSGLSIHWVILPHCLQFMYSKLPPRPPMIQDVVLHRDQCWCSMEGKFPMQQGWVWEILGFSVGKICIRLWRVDGGVMNRLLRVGASVRLVSPSYGAASLVWASYSELLSGEGWLQGEMYRILLGPDVNSRGVSREIVAMFKQPPVKLFKSEMEIGLLSTIHEYANPFQGSDLYTDGSVVQENNPVINALIPSPLIHRTLGAHPLVAGALIARPDAPAAHGMRVAFRAEDGHLAGCGNSYDVEMVMLTLACLVRDQLKEVDSPILPVWSDCKSAVLKASMVDISQVRKFGHKAHGLLLRRMYYSRCEDTSLLRHVKGHPERRLEKRWRWQELSGSDAGIFLADKLANVKMGDDERYLWENDGSIQAPLVTIPLAEILKVFACIDLWSVIGKDGIPIISSPLSIVQECRFHRYLRRRDTPRVDKLWTQYIPTGPAAAFPDERSYHRRSKITKVVFNWYLRAEHMGGVNCVEEGVHVTDEDDLGTQTADGGSCQLCGQGMMGDTERHLYVFCSHPSVVMIRDLAEDDFRKLVRESTGMVQEVLQKFQVIFLDADCRHRVWKGMLSPDQGRFLSDSWCSTVNGDRQTPALITRMVREGFRIGGTALLNIRKAVWKLGGPVLKPPRARDANVRRKRGLASLSTPSIVTSLSGRTPLESARWELDRYRRRRDRLRTRQTRGSGLSLSALAEGSQRRNGLAEDTRRNGQSARGEDPGRLAKLWDVH